MQVAKRKLIKSNQRLVLKVVGTYNLQKRVPVDDLLVAGLRGLETGVDRFQPSRGNRLSTVAYMWICEAVRRVFTELAVAITIPGRVKINVGIFLSSLCSLTAL